MADNRRLTTDDIAGRATDRHERPEDRSALETAATPRNPTTAEGGQAALFDEAEAAGFRSRWEAIQTGFVDEPRAAVEQADALVAETMKRLAEVFSGERTTLEQQWDRGDNISTEDLRIALKKYRSFFERLLTI